MKINFLHLLIFSYFSLFITTIINAQHHLERLPLNNNSSYQGERLHIHLEKELASEPIMVLPNDFPQEINQEGNLNLLITAKTMNNNIKKVDEVIVELMALDPIPGGGTNPIIIKPKDADNEYAVHENISIALSDFRLSTLYTLKIYVIIDNKEIVFESRQLIRIKSSPNIKVYPIPFESVLYFDFEITNTKEKVSLGIETLAKELSVISNKVYSKGKHTIAYKVTSSMGRYLTYSLSIGSKKYRGRILKK
ncbi:hypothetical protein [Aquimarina algicola]|uniref:Uncharacterized protein n=1 Tax=Aquimarina algicola TaxID=2589995 RepID=A0A504JID5_9FLAO|nr:hypothetical protein [Aquimarina algicola]TPN87373.1 hypothetical protein FHK87_07240 [Aquimarina algicola]